MRYLIALIALVICSGTGAQILLQPGEQQTLECLIQDCPDCPACPPQLSDCEDGIDNDNDGATDLLDPGCADPSDPFEWDQNPPVLAACEDGADNDGDGLVDYPADPGCDSLADDDEFNAPPPVAQCEDGLDNDSDGLVDLADPGCLDAQDNDEFNAPPPTGGAVTLEWDIRDFQNNESAFNLTAIDVDADGDLDLIAGDHNPPYRHQVLTNDGNGQFASSFQDFGSSTSGRCSLNAFVLDGMLACGDNDINSSRFTFPGFNPTSGNCGPPFTGDSRPRFAVDWNGDGQDDCLNSVGDIYTVDNVLIYNGPDAYAAGDFGSGLQTVSFTETGGGSDRFALVEDFDGDGVSDLFTLVGERPKFFSGSPLVEVASIPGNRWDDSQTGYGSASAGDFDNDGDMDLVISADVFSRGYFLYRNDGGFQFTEIALSGGLGSGWPGGRTGTASGDFNGDGITDFAVIAYPGNPPGQSPAQIRVYINQGISDNQAKDEGDPPGKRTARLAP